MLVVALTAALIGGCQRDDNHPQAETSAGSAADTRHGGAAGVDPPDVPPAGPPAGPPPAASSPADSPGDSPSDDPGDVARSGLPAFLDAAWPQRADFGFRETDRREQATLGVPWPVLELNAATCATWRAGRPLDEALVSAGEWIYPVGVDDEPRTLLGVRRIGDTWRPVYLGNPQLAASLAAIRRAWADTPDAEPLLVSCTSPRAFFLTVRGQAPESLTPITIAPVFGDEVLSPPSDWLELTPATVTVEQLEAFWAAQDTR